MAKDKGKKSGEKKTDGDSPLVQDDGGKKRMEKVAKRGIIVTVILVVAIVVFIVLSAIASFLSSIGEAISPSSKKTRTLPVYTTVTLRYSDTLQILPGEGFYLGLSSDTSGVVYFPNLVTIQFQSTGPFQFLRKGKEPLVGYPGLEGARWGVIPNEARFRALDGKCTLLITTKGW